VLGQGLKLLAASLGFCILSVGVADFNGRRGQLKIILFVDLWKLRIRNLMPSIVKHTNIHKCVSVLRVYCECQPTELCVRSTKLSENRVDKISTRQGGMKLQ